jgi:hypothetical protein
MKHYLAYQSDGSISGICSYQQAGTGLRGWPDDYELDNPESDHTETRNWLASAKNPPTGGHIRYDCPCPRTAAQCNCASVIQMTRWVSDGQLTDKITTFMKVDGEIVASGSVISRPPGTPIALRFEFDGVPDGEVIGLSQFATPMVLESTETAIPTPASGGAIETIAYAPAQGLVGAVRVFGRICTMMEVRIRGWGV